ncbi:thialysine N-epsilon-acetyltransferase-like [Ostrinia nubilalis]|uniref:thialysine N-epsilon-acetyltransferase-like n=1 Tax=Ostrinia nubilalis TaxID=29057 RepID=UPI0030822E6D
MSSTAGAGAAGAEGAVTVRAARREDVPHVHRMIHELAAYEGVPDGPKLSVEDLLEDGFDAPSPWYFLLVAEQGGTLVGYALCNRAYSSWTRRAFYVEDIYVPPEHRHAGVGAKLFKEICRLGVREGVHRVDWHVLESNAPALAFYARLGARDMRASEGRAALRLDRHRIEYVADNY